MTRILKTSTIPDASEFTLEDFKVLTPHRAAAKALGVNAKSLETLARRVVREHGYTIAPSMYAYGTLRRAVREVVGTADAGAVASRISQILKTVLRTGIDVGLLKEHGSAQVKELAAVAEEYRRRLREQNMIDRDETLLFAASLKPQKRKILVYGYFRGRVEETEFIDAVADEGSVYFLPVASHHSFTVNRSRADWLIERGWSEDAGAPKVAGIGQEAALRFVGISKSVVTGLTAEVFSDIDAEIRGTLTKVKQLVSSGTRPQDVAVMCRNVRNYGPVIAPVAEEYGLRMDMTFPMPISETNLGGYLFLLLNTLQEFDFENVLRVFMHPFGLRLNDEMLAKAYKFHPKTPEDWVKIGVYTHVLQAPERQTREDWNRFLNKIFETYEIKRTISGRTREFIAYERFTESLKEFCYEPDEELSLDQWMSEVLEIMSSVSVPFNPSRGGVSFHDPDTIIGGRFKHIFVIGASEGDLPAGVSENPVVDFHERKILAGHGVHFEGAADVPRWEAMSFYFSLLTSTDSVSMSFPQTVNTESRLESSFFEELGASPSPASPKEDSVSSIKEQRRSSLRRDDDSSDEVLGAARKSFTVESSRESREPQNEFDGNTGVPYLNPDHVWSVSQLTTIGQCGFRWFANKLLHLEPIDEMEGELTPSTRGSLYHKVLELAANRLTDGQDARSGILAVLEECFAEAEKDPEIGLPILSNWEKERLDHIQILRKAVEAEAFIQPDAKIVGTEVEFFSEWRGFKLKGYIDRLDRTPEGIIAIDYKTSSVPPKGAKDSKGSTKLDIQLPLYLKSAVPSLTDLSGGEQGIGGWYYSLTKGKKLREVDLEQEEELEKFAERVKKMLADGDFSVDPDKQRNACTYCDFSAVCRYGSRIERKREVTENEVDT